MAFGGLACYARKLGSCTTMKLAPDNPKKQLDFAYMLLLLLINVLNLADLAFTYLALGAGYHEGNPFMRELIAVFDTTNAGLIKLGITAAFTLAAWFLRERRGMSIIVMAVLVVYFLLFVFHLYVTLALV